MLSIIIPCYNDHANVGQILDRLAPELGAEDFEVVVVDDASTAADLDAFARFRPVFGDRLVLLRNKTNAGPGPTRNVGLEAAKGTDICFIDSDDMPEENFLFYYRQLVRDFDFNVAMFRHHIQEVPDEPHTFRMFDESYWDRLSREFPVTRTLQLWQVPYMILTINYPWNKFYKRDYLLRNAIRFPKLALHEDIPFHWHAMMMSEKSIFAVDYPPLYVHNRIDQRGRATEQTDKRRMQLIEASDITLDIISRRKHLMMYYPIFLRFFLDTVPWAEKKLPSSFRPEFLEKCQRLLRKHYRDEVFTYVQQVDPPLFESLRQFLSAEESA